MLSLQGKQPKFNAKRYILKQKTLDPILLRRFLKCMHGDLEETKKLIELNYELRNKSPEIFINRDPEDEQSLQTYETV